MNATVVHGKPLTMFYVLVRYVHTYYIYKIKKNVTYVPWFTFVLLPVNFKCKWLILENCRYVILLRSRRS